MESRPNAYLVVPLARHLVSATGDTQGRPLVSRLSPSSLSRLSFQNVSPSHGSMTCRPIHERTDKNDTLANKRSVKSKALD